MMFIKTSAEKIDCHNIIIAAVFISSYDFVILSLICQFCDFAAGLTSHDEYCSAFLTFMDSMVGLLPKKNRNKCK